MRAAFIRLKDDIRAAFIRGPRLFEGGVYIRKYGIHDTHFHSMLYAGTMCMYLCNEECNVNHVLRVYTYSTKNVK